MVREVQISVCMLIGEGRDLRSCTFLGVRAHFHHTVPPCRRAFGSRNLPILVLRYLYSTWYKQEGSASESRADQCIVFLCLYVYVLGFYVHIEHVQVKGRHHGS